MKPVVFIGSSLDDLRAFPNRPRHDAGFQLERVQRGLDPDDWKPMHTIGPGYEKSGYATRAARFASSTSRHLPRPSTCCTPSKKTQRTSQRDLALAQSRFRELKRGAMR